MNVAICLLLLNGIQSVRKPTDTLDQIARAAFEQIGVTTGYSQGYFKINYPNGDVSQDRGVCTDVVIRAFRKAGIDLQEEIHLDMAGHFSAYPRLWGLKAPDPNIDHRRVPNKMKYFQRHGKSVPIQSEVEPGDVIAWRLPNGLYHIGIASNERVQGKNHFFMVHNIGAGAKLEDVLFLYKIIGHYRW
jgi:uncharacterized protein